MANLINSVLEDYLKAYRGLVAAEQVDDRSVTLSFPMHFSANHRIELTITQVNENRYIISDIARVMTELRNAGHRLDKELRQRLSDLARVSGVRFEREYLLLESDGADLGKNIQNFLETAKTIGDVYFVHKPKRERDKQIQDKVQRVLDDRRVAYQRSFELDGEFTPHKFDFYVPPNGTEGLALKVLGAENTKLSAELWAFRCDDVRRQPRNEHVRVGLVIDSQQHWRDEEKMILKSRAHVVVDDKEVDMLRDYLASKKGA